MKYILLISIVLFSFGCRKQKSITKLKAIRNSVLIEELSNSQLEYEWFQAKISSSVESKRSKKSFKTNVKMRKDSAIWLSISPLLGIEIVRVLITPDSVKVLDKLSNTYFLGDMNSLKKQYNINVEFGVLQDMIVANALLFDPTEKFKSVKAEASYMVTSQTPRKFRKAVGIQNRNGGGALSMDTVLLTIDERKYRKALRKNEEEDLIVKRYWLSPKHKKPIRTLISDVVYERIIEANYTDFEILETTKDEDVYFPDKVNYKLTDKHNVVTIGLKYSKIRLGQKSNLPFKIPKGFKPLETNDEN